MFTLKIPVTWSGLDTIKAELTRTLREVKSSHRCEAVARGLDFRTYAALLAATRSPNPIVVSAQGAVFSTYLAEHGFNAPPIFFYRAVARVAIRAVLERLPRLTFGGIGIGEPRKKGDGTWENWQDLQARFNVEREDLLSDSSIESFLLSLAFLSRVEPTKTIRPATNSYWLKHIAENYVCTYPEGGKLGPGYVPNGVLIAAAVHAGFETKSDVTDRGYDDLNVKFNMSKSSLEFLDSEIRPDGVTAQDRRRRRAMRGAKSVYSPYI